MRRRARLIFCRFLLPALLISGLAQGTAADADAPLTVIHVGGVLSDDMTPVIYAERSGMFKREGLDVQIVSSTSGSAMAQAVISGTYEFGKSSMLSAINAHLRNIPLEIVAAGGTYDSRAPFAALCVADDSTAASGKDFEGKTIGSPALNDLNQLVVSAWVDEHGGDWKTLHFVELPNATAAAALAAHRVDAAVMLQPSLAEAVTTKQVRSIALAYDAIGPSFVFAAYFTSSDYAKNHPDIVAKFVRVVYAAAAYTNKHHAATAAMMADVTSIPVDTIARMPRVDGATALDPKAFQPVIDAAAKYHLISQGFPARDMLANAPGLK